MLDRCGGNKREASRALGISYHTLIVYLRQGEPTPPNGWHDAATENPAGDTRQRGAGPVQA